MKVLVIAADGFIGHDVALSFVRAGHDVFGTTRNLPAVKHLRAAEITPVICDLLTPSEYREYIQQVDVVVDVSGGIDVAELGPLIFRTTLEEAQKARPMGPPLTYIYCSGSWLHGDSKTDVLSDRTPITQPVALTAWRASLEQKILASICPSLTVNIIRPGMVYGGNSSVLGYTLFESAKEGQVIWFGDSDAYMPTVHKEDLGEAFRLCAEKVVAQYLTELLRLGNPQSEPVSIILKRLHEVSGAEGVTLKKPDNDFERALASSAIIRPQLAKSLLGWEARKQPLAEGMETYYIAWQASHP